MEFITWYPPFETKRNESAFNDHGSRAAGKMTAEISVIFGLPQTSLSCIHTVSVTHSIPKNQVHLGLLAISGPPKPLNDMDQAGQG
jgi:hypothetical protein